MSKAESLQDRFAPNSVCFGCGPSNPRGLHIKSVPEGDGIVADWRPEAYHTAFAGFGSGGIISVLLDCHGNWAASYALMITRKLSHPPGTVTSEYTVKFLKPTAVDKLWHLTAKASRIDGDRVHVEGGLEVDGKMTAMMKGVFVAVRDGHPAFHRWQ